MNEIITPVTPDKEVGFDSFGQFVSWETREDDGSKIGTIIADLREATCVICGNRFELSGPGLRNQFRIDSLELWAHLTCYKGHVALKEGFLIHGALREATQDLFMGWRFKHIPNEYGAAWNTPWYQAAFVRYPQDPARRGAHNGVATAFAIKFGPRKRVYHLSLHRPDFDFSKYHPITNDETTKYHSLGEIVVHAWTDEKVTEYLKAMVKIVMANSQEP